MKEHASGSQRTHALASAPAWFIEACNRNLRAQNRPEIEIAGRKNNDHRFTPKQRAYNMKKAQEQAKPMTVAERVKDKAKRLRASKKRAR